MPVFGKKERNQVVASNRSRIVKNKPTKVQKTTLASSANSLPVEKCKNAACGAEQRTKVHSSKFTTSMPRNGANNKHRHQPEMKCSASLEAKQLKNQKKEQQLESLVALMNGGALSKTEAASGGSNPLGYTTSVAPDAMSFPFLCQSCATVRYEKFWDLRIHEDWCGRVTASGGACVMCNTCFRRYRNHTVLNRHVNEAHRSCEIDVKTADGVEIGLHITRMTETNTLNYSTVCAPDAAQFPYICASCCMVCFADVGLLQQHEDWCGRSSNVAGFACPKCIVSFRTNDLLERHQRHCNKTNKNMLEIKPQPDVVCTQDDFTDTSCPICSVQLCSRIEQQSHLRTVHSLDDRSTTKVEAIVGPVQYSRQYMRCSNCGMRFTVYKHLEQHMEHCSKKSQPVNSRVISAAQDANLPPGTVVAEPVAHSRYWQQSNIIHCGDCGEQFSSRLLLSQHKRHCREEGRLPFSAVSSQSPEKIELLNARKGNENGQVVTESCPITQSSSSPNACVAIKKYRNKDVKKQPGSMQNCNEPCSKPQMDTRAKMRRENSVRKRICSTNSTVMAKKTKSEESAVCNSSNTKHCLLKDQQKCTTEAELLQNKLVADVESEAGGRIDKDDLKNGLVSNGDKCTLVVSKSAAVVKLSKETRQNANANKCKGIKQTAKLPAGCRKSERKSAVSDVVGNNEPDSDCSITSCKKDSFRTIEIVDRKNVKCAKCRVHLKTVRQIAEHVCL